MLPLLRFLRKVLFRRFMIFQCIIMTQMLSIYLSPNNNSDKAFEEQIFMSIKSRKIVSNMIIYGVHIHCVRYKIITTFKN